MSPEAQRIAIAEACGWKMRTEEVEHIDGFQWTETRKFWTSPTGKSYSLPDFLNDLNAMHEAEILIRKNYDIYGAYLQYLNRTAPECRVHANAGQKAEAFLRAIGKWEEEAKP